jgi:type IV pilus assembly protein PilF
MRQFFAVLAILGTLACSSSSPPSPSASGKPAADQPSNPLYAFTLMRQGSVLLQQGRYEDALKRFQEADAHSPGNATVHNMIGLCYLKMESYENALKAFDKALELIPSFTDARNNRGATYLALKKYQLAEVDFVAVLADTTYPHRWEVYYNLGMSYLERRQTGAAEENFRRAAFAPTPVFEAYLRLADIAQQRGEISGAIDLLEEARLKFPERLEAPLELGRLLMRAGRVEEARTQLQHVIDADPGSTFADQARQLLEGH